MVLNKKKKDWFHNSRRRKSRKDKTKQTNMRIETKNSQVVWVHFTTFLFGVTLPNLKYHNSMINTNTRGKDSITSSGTFRKLILVLLDTLNVYS